MNCGIRLQHVANRISLAWTKRHSPAMFGKRGRCVVRSDEPEGIAIPTKDVAEVGVTDAGGLVQHGSEHRLKIAGRAAYNPENFGGSSLLL